MKIGSMNNPHNSILDEIRLFGEMGLDYVDLTIEYPEATPEKLLKKEGEIKDLLSTSNMGLTGHMPWFFEVSHPYPAVRDAFMAESLRIVDVAAKFGVDKLSTHTDHMDWYKKAGGDRMMEAVVDFFSKLTEACEERGILFCIENFDFKNFTFDNFRRLFEEIPKMGFVLDVGHANLYGTNGEGITKAADELGGKLAHVHVHDNKGLEDEHLPVGAGYINWKKTLGKLKSTGYDKTITLEIHSQDREYIRISKEKIEKMWDES